VTRCCRLYSTGARRSLPAAGATLRTAAVCLLRFARAFFLLPFVLDWCPAQFARSRRNNANSRGMFASVCAVVFFQLAGLYREIRPK
jgi:hypothetical protein